MLAKAVAHSQKAVFILTALLAANLLHGAERPNVLLIAADDLRNDLGCYGHTEVISPHLDRLASRSVVFQRAYCQQAVCNPSRASLMTGRRPDTLRIWDLPTHFRELNPDVVTLPQYFKQQGYFTQNIGKIFHNWIHEIQGDPVSWSVPAVMHFANHGRDLPVVEGNVPPNLASDPKCFIRDVPDEAYFDGRVASLAVKALQERAHAKEPFFLAVGFWKPHSPFNAPKKYWDLYDRSKLSFPGNQYWPLNAPRIAWHDSREILTDKHRELSAEAVLEIRHGYLANISYMDAQIGRVLDELDRLDLAKHTIVVFWSDHGYHLGEQTLWAKTSNFELDARVPLMFSVPGMTTSGGSTDSLAELLDMYPTLVELCGLDRPQGLDGISLVPVLRDPRQEVRSSALTQHPRPAYYDRESDKTPQAMGYSLRTPQFRYVDWRDWKTGETIATELYDHVQDPIESRNIAGEAEYRDALEKCRLELERSHPIVRPRWTPVLPRESKTP